MYSTWALSTYALSGNLHSGFLYSLWGPSAIGAPKVDSPYKALLKMAVLLTGVRRQCEAFPEIYIFGGFRRTKISPYQDFILFEKRQYAQESWAERVSVI